jgi:hypothetical protein
VNLKETLAAEHSKKQCNRIVAWIGADKKRFAQLMHLFFDSEYRIVQRAAWPISYCARSHPELIKPYFSQLLVKLKRPDVHDAVRRNTVRLLQDVDIPRRYHGQIMETCFGFIQSLDTAGAIKAFSLSILSNLAKSYPGIIPELQLIIRDRWDYEKAAFRSRAKKILQLKSTRS